MKNLILLPAFIFCLAAGLRAADDCDKSADACRPKTQELTPFMAGIKKAERTTELKQGAARETALRQGSAKAAALKQGEPGARLAALSTAAAASGRAGDDPAGAAPAGPLTDKELLSKPAWLLAVGALLAGLYYFLKEGKTRRKRA